MGGAPWPELIRCRVAACAAVHFLLIVGSVAYLRAASELQHAQQCVAWLLIVRECGVCIKAGLELVHAQQSISLGCCGTNTCGRWG